MGFGLLLVPAVGGYWLLTHWHYTSFRAARDSGYHLLFRSAAVGFLLYVLSHLVVLCACWVDPDLFRGWERFIGEPFTPEVVLSLALGLVAPYALDIFCDKEECARMAAREFGDHIELLLDRAMRDQRLIEVNLQTRRTYVGLAMESGIGKSGDADLVVLPVYSGHRDEKTLSLTLDTNYFPVLERRLLDVQLSPRDRRSADFLVTIPLEEVVSARLFDKAVYDAMRGIGGDVETEQQSLATNAKATEKPEWSLLTFIILVLLVSTLFWVLADFLPKLLPRW